MTSSCVVTSKQSSIVSYDRKPNDLPPPSQPNTQHPHPLQSTYSHPYYPYNNQPTLPHPSQQIAYLSQPPLRNYPSTSVYPYYSSSVPCYGRRPSSPSLGLTERGDGLSATESHLYHHSQHNLPPLADSTRQRSPPTPNIQDNNTAAASHRRRQPTPLRAINSMTTSRAVKEKRTFACQVEDCGKVFKRSEHLKRHNRSIHTNEKPFECPYQQCLKRFSRSDNLNQHIRIHRHSSKESSTP